MKKIAINTKEKRQVLDITDLINKHLQGSGFVNIFVTHTTCAITTADLDPGTDKDYIDAFTEMVPKLNYKHPHNPSHMPDHILSSLIGTSLTIPFEEGKLLLGIWQRVVLIELDGPRDRQVIVSKGTT
jgi:secondary thiamine-phosphate synthase enzyme